MRKISEIFIKIGAIIISVIVCFIPVWLFLLLRFLLSPEGFWQNLFVYGLGFYFLIGIQIFLLIIFIKFFIIIFDE